MVILKKVVASSLVEVIIASAIVLVLFFICSLTLNNAFKSIIASNDDDFRNRLNEIQYLVEHNRMAVPFAETTAQWEIDVFNDTTMTIIDGFHIPSNETMTLKVTNEN